MRKLGGLYVLGSERHESRRIDNQLRGRSGRQGDLGESRFYLSLDDELLRLFATGAMSWVMGRTLPEDMPIESKTVAKAIERAENTVEARNAEIRKDALKYDEVMDQQRKVIYGRRLDIIDGEDLEEHTEDLLAGVAEKLVAEYCPNEFEEDWDIKGLVDELTQYYPTKFTVADLEQAGTTDDLIESIVEEALDYYEKHSESMPGGTETMRQIERDVMLQIMDARWRDHLTEMDNLKDGIHLRWTVQADPLNAWQQEGYSMFGQLLEVVDNDYLRYIMHVEALKPAAAEPDLDRAVYVAAEDPVAETGALASALLVEQGANVAPQTAGSPAPEAGGNGRRWQRIRWSESPSQAAERPRPRRGRRRSSSSSTRRWAATILAGAGAGRSTSSVMAPPEGLSASAPRDLNAELVALGSRLAEAERYLGLDKFEARRSELEAEAARPDLWDDPDRARRVTKELGRVSADLDQLVGLRTVLDDALALLELTEESAAAGARDVSLEAELVDTVDSLGTRLAALELQSLFSGEYDELDAVCEVHAGAGGTDAQDWAEMLLRMYQRWAERRGYSVEVDEATEGQEAGSALCDLHCARSFRLRSPRHRARRAPPRADVAVRLPAPPPDELRLHGRDAVPRGRVGGDRHRREGPAHRHLPILGCRRPACEQDRLGGAPHPSADGDRRLVPEPAQPAPEQGEGDADPRGQAGGAGARRASGRARRSERRARRQRVGQPDPLVRARSLPARQGPA